MSYVHSFTNIDSALSGTAEGIKQESILLHQQFALLRKLPELQDLSDAELTKQLHLQYMMQKRWYSTITIKL